MSDLMIDIETLGTKPGCVILSISAVWFSIETGATGEEFDIKIDPSSCNHFGLEIDTDTFLWWMKQDVEARMLAFCSTEEHGLSNALETFIMFYNAHKAENTTVWANSPSFDLRILEFAFEVCGLSFPWKFSDERDVRTLVSFAPEIKKQEEFVGIPHYGIDDCKHQIKYCSKIFQKINSGLKPNLKE